MRPAKLKPITHVNFFKSIRKIGWVAGGLLICATLFGLGAFSDSSRTAAHGNNPIAPTAPQQSGGETSTPIKPVSVSVVNFRQLAEQEARRQTTAAPEVHEVMPVPGTIQDSPAAPDSPKTNNTETPANDNIGGPLVPSPAPSTSYQGEFDEAVGGGPTGTFTIPPDTMGAVGLDKVFVNVNNNYVIQDKATGARLSVVSPATFWASTGGSGFFDPRTAYDPYNNRWILSIVSNAQTANSSVEVAISQTSDPAGTYNMYRFIVGTATLWADFPMQGFNKNWVAISMNMFTISTNAFSTGKVLVLDYPQLRAGTGSATPFTSASIGFCNHPATTFSPTENTLYLAQHLSSASATYDVSTITGTPAAPVLTVGATKTRPGGGWTQPSGDILPQTCVGVVGTTCPATLRFIDSGDAQIRSNVVFRNGNLYYPQTVGIPAGGLTHTAAQWTMLDAATGNFVDGGRVEDPTATNANGGKWYAYPSITANKNGDVMLGFSQFASNQFAAAGYTFRLATDAAGTMRDPNIYKAGEDYYSKTFSGTRNRWGDYSHTVVDPSNDRDMWSLQEYAGTRTVPDANTVSNNSRWATWWAKVSVPAGAGVSGFSGSDLLVSEFRLRGPNGATDEFVEIYNNTIGPLTILTLDGSPGYGVAASDGVIRCTIPNGTTIPSRGHYLCVNSVGYSLASYPAGNGTTATGDATYTTDIPDNVGIALFNTATVANFSTTTRLDAVGSTSEANTLYKEGTGYPALIAFSIDEAFYRDLCALSAGKCTIATPKDTENNANDLLFVDTKATSAGAGQRLGAPGPENLSSPIYTPAAATLSVLDSTKATGVAPNFVRDFTSDPANNSTFGTISLRRRLANTSGESITRLRFRVIDITTFPAPPGTADLRPRTSPTIVVSGVNDPATCGVLPTPCAVTVEGTTLEQPPSQPNGGGFNSSLSAGTVTLGLPLVTGTSVNLQFLLGIQQTGNVRFAILTEGLTTSGRGVAAGIDYYVGTDAGGAPTAAPATITGRVTTSDGAPLAGVTMNLSGARSARTISDANGNYRFTNVDTDNFYTVAPSLVNHHFNPPALSFSLLANKTDGTFTATRDVVITGNAIDTPGFFVRQHYLDFLGREPDESGLNFWSDQMVSCGADAACLERKTINVSAAYFLSIEFQQTGGLVDGLYRASYGRHPLFAEFTPDAQTVSRNVVVGTTDWAQTLEANKQAFVETWVQRADFRAAYDGLTNAAYIDRLIANTRVTLSAAERDALLTGLDSGTMTRTVALRRITEDERFVSAKRNEMFVMMEYFGYLRRDPDDSGYQFWLNKLNQFGGNFERAEMVKAFINSGEYRNRFR